MIVTDPTQISQPETVRQPNHAETVIIQQPANDTIAACNPEHQRSIEAALRESEDRYRMAVASAKLGTWDWDLITHQLKWDASCKAMFGLPPEAESNIDLFFSGLHPEDRDRLSEIVQSALNPESGGMYSTEYRTIGLEDGIERWIAAKGQAYFSPTGQPLRFIGTVLDITEEKQREAERQRAQAQLRDRQERLEAALFASETGTFRWNILTNELDWDDNLDRLFGLPPGQTARSLEAFIAMVHPDDRQAVIDLCNRCATEGIDFDLDFRVVYPDGSIHWLLDKGKAVFDANGTPIYMTGACVDISDRKKIEEELQQRNGILKAINDFAPTPIFVKDRSGRLVFANPATLDALGKTASEVIGHRDDEIFPELAETIVVTDQRIMETGEPETIEEVIHGNRTYLSVKVPYRDETGAVIGLVGVASDISDRKQAELEIRKFASLAANSTEFIGMCDLNLVPIYVNPAGRQMVGLEASDDVSRLNVTDFYFPEDRAFIAEDFFPQVLRDGQAEVEIRLRHFKTGEAIWMDYTLFQIQDANNQPIGFATVSRNITQRKETDLRLELAQQVGNAGFFDWRVLEGTATVTGLLRRIAPVDSQTGLVKVADWIKLIHPEDLHRVRSLIQSAFAAHQTQLSYSFRVSTSEGELWLESQAQVEYNEAGQPDRVIGINMDITDRMQIERDREHLLQQEQAAREASERANRMKDEFLAVLSHELRTPLNPILGWSKMLKSGRLKPEKTQEALSIIERNAQLQAQLIEDLLDISRILQGKLALHSEPVYLASVITSAQETVRLAAEAKQIAIALELDANVGAVLGDAGRLQQVVWNLLTNAVKFTPEGGQVIVRLTPIGTHAQIQVIDTGKGISAEFLPHVFEQFRQADSSTTRKFGGLGLGLAIVRQLIELHGGTIVAESQGEGQGAMFTIQLPLLKPINNQRFEFDSSATANYSKDGLQGYQILVVDDETDSREFVAFVLEQSGAIVEQVASAFEALESLSQKSFDALVSDVGMPEMNGYSLIQQVRTNGGQIPALALTAYAGENELPHRIGGWGF
ncbi:PAS domain-containing protein [Pseudanabaenaceae cyanobacterium LEGE 13415]|nr:PAS domain-containing protein [Pseudanabaenaceae cyanobacterium LEGE 13415]